MEPKRITETAMAQLCQFQFPGNVRQLENICHWLTVMAPAQVIEAKDLPPEVLQTSPVQALGLSVGGSTVGELVPSSVPAAVLSEAAMQPAFTVSASADWESILAREVLQSLAEGRTDVWDVYTRQFEACLIQAALSTTRGRRIEAAQKLGIGRNTITRKIQELGIDDEE